MNDDEFERRVRKWLKPERDLAQEAHDAAEQHLSACEAALAAADWWGEGDGPVEWPETAGPYCGCPTCIVREVLTAAWPLLRELAIEEQK